MNKVSLDEIKKLELELLDLVDKVCRENDIEYSLGGGSLLGSVRHKGFIPWDDDIDIMLTRENYDKLIKLLSHQEEAELWHYSIKETFQPYAKLCNKETYQAKAGFDFLWPKIGVNIDIFPMDSMPSNEEERIEFMHEAQHKAEILYSTSFPAFVSGSKWYYSLARLFLRGPKYLKYHGKNKQVARDVDEFMSKYQLDSNANQIGFLASRYFDKEHFQIEIFEEYEEVKFENLAVRKIVDHDSYLRQIHGDYMQLPPENQRINHDYVTFYWKED